MKQLDCEEAARRLHAFLDRELDETEIGEVQRTWTIARSVKASFASKPSLKRLIMTRSSEESVSYSLRERPTRRLRQQN